MTKHTSKKKYDMRGLTPESWCCIDCGINTAPGMSNRVEMEQAIEKAQAEGWWGSGRGIPQQVNQQSEAYCVRSSVWEKAGMEPGGGCLCVGCLEKRLGRQLTPKDFKRGHSFDHPDFPGTARLIARRKGVPEIEIVLERLNDDESKCVLHR